MKIELNNFSGERPKTAPHLLDQNQAQVANNAKLIKGDLRAWKAPLRKDALSLTLIKSLFIFEENGNSHWVESANDLDHARSPIAGDQYERVYFTGETEPRFFANDVVSSPFDPSTDFVKLGISKPGAAPTVGSSGGGTEYRAYVYCYVTRYGDVGPPSDVGSISDYASGNVTLDNIADAPTGRAITKIYVYRTNSGSAGVAEFQFVLEATWFDSSVSYSVGDFVVYSGSLYKCTTAHTGAWDAADFTAGDDVANADLGEVISSINYDPPPADLTGLISLPNGVFAGFVGNELYLSEPYLPHAWPPGYVMSFDHQIVALGYFGTTVVVLTDGYPFLVFGSHPSSMAKQRIASFYPCLSKRGVVSAENSVFSPAKDGLIRIDQNGAVNATFNLMDNSDWQERSPGTIHGHFYAGKYFGFPATQIGFVIDFGNDLFFPINVVAHTGHVSIGDGKFYIVTDDTDAIDENNPPETMPLCVKQWEGDDNNYMYYTWKSKEFVLDFDINFAVAKILLDTSFYSYVVEQLDLADLNETLFAGDIQGSLGSNAIGTMCLAGDILYDLAGFNMTANVSFKLYVDGELKIAKVVSEPDSLFTLPTGFEGKRYEIEISGYIPVKMVAVAPSVEELMT